MKKILNVTNLKINYGEVCAVKDVSFHVREGQIVSITGTNGAGKSSTMNALTGIFTPSAGNVVFFDEDITGMPAHVIAKKGMIQVPEGRHLFANLSVRENLLLGKHCSGGVILNKSIPERILETFPILRDYLDKKSSNLSGGQAQILSLARGLMNNPKLLLLDEPTLGLAPILVKEILKLITTLNKEGLSILLVEQNVYPTLQISDYTYVFEGGRIVNQDNGKVLLKDSRFLETYLGINRV